MGSLGLREAPIRSPSFPTGDAVEANELSRRSRLSRILCQLSIKDHVSTVYIRPSNNPKHNSYSRKFPILHQCSGSTVSLLTRRRRQEPSVVSVSGAIDAIGRKKLLRLRYRAPVALHGLARRRLAVENRRKSSLLFDNSTGLRG
jgi:hypothetical protein